MKLQAKIALLAAAMVLIFALELVALTKGIDGTALAASFAGIGGIAGYVLKHKGS